MGILSGPFRSGFRVRGPGSEVQGPGDGLRASGTEVGWDHDQQAVLLGVCDHRVEGETDKVIEALGAVGSAGARDIVTNQGATVIDLEGIDGSLASGD